MNKAALISRIRDLSDSMSPISTDQPSRLQSLPSVQCVAFDFYGTMFLSGVGDIGVDEDQSPTNRNLFEEALHDSGFTLSDDNAAEQGLYYFSTAIREYKESRRSHGIDHPEPDIVLIWYEVLNKLLNDNQIEGGLTREIAQRFAVEYEFRFNAVWPVPDLMDTLESLRQKRFVLGIISNSQFYTPLAFEALTDESIPSAGFDQNLLIWSYQASVKKPSLDFYQHFVDALQYNHTMHPGQVLYVGNDMLKDIMPASKLGMRTALFAGDTRSLKLRPDDPRCKDVEPDLVITELNQITKCVGIAV